MFEVTARKWRGIGVIAGSGLALRPEFAAYDALRRFDVAAITTEEPADCEAEDEVETDESETADEACEVVAAPEPETPLDPTVPNSHGAWVMWVAQSDAVGGRNCNHGGAVSEAAKKDQEAVAEAREARKAERAAERQLRAEEREAAKAARSANTGKGKGKGH